LPAIARGPGGADILRPDGEELLSAVDLEQALRLNNRNMIAFDLILGSGALLAPRHTLAVLGHDQPSADAEHLFRRCGPIWLTFAIAHAVADRRDEPRDWWALAWLRGTELTTDIVWSRSPAFSRPGARAGLWLAAAANLAMTLGYGWLAERRRRRPRRRLRRS
jgi:hypothetical protein